MDGLLRLMTEMQNVEFTYNPELRSWERAQPDNTVGKGYIETPGDVKNIVWQTREVAPTESETALADGLEEVLGEGAETLDQIAVGLNARNLLAPGGVEWTADSLASELHRLGA